jgi:phage protein D
MTNVAPDDRIVSLPDRYIPVYQVYFAHDTYTPTPGAAGAPIDGVDEAIAAEISRIQQRVVRASGPGLPAPSLSQLIPLAGPFGDNPGQQTNDVISVQFKEEIEGEGLATLSVDLFNVYDFTTNQYRYTDDPIGAPGTGPLIDYGVTLALFFGYQNADPAAGSVPSNVAPVFEGIITKLDLTFPADGAPTVKITATDKRDRLRYQKGIKPSRFVGVSEEQIAATVAAQFGLKVAVRTGQQTMPDGPVQLPSDQDALQFMHDRAKKGGLELRCFGNTIFLTTPGDVSGQTPLGYQYRRGLTSFSASIDGNGKPTSVKLVARDPTSQQTYTATVTVQDLQAAGLAPPGSTVADVIEQQGQGGNRQEVVTNYHAKSQNEARTLAMGILKRNLDSALTASGEVIGDPALRAGAALEIRGVGTHYSGPYYVTSVTHTFGSGGYQTSFEARRNSAPGSSNGASS